MIQYGILDDEGQVVRWVWDKPSVPHVTRKEPRPKRKRVNYDSLPDAPF